MRITTTAYITYNYSRMTKSGMKFAVQRVYYDMPDLLEEALKWIDKYWKGNN